MAIRSDSVLAALPVRYSKFIASLIGLFITYVTIYGWTWHLETALIMIGTALGVVGVPNGPPPAIAVPVPVATGGAVTTAARPQAVAAPVAPPKA